MSSSHGQGAGVPDVDETARTAGPAVPDPVAAEATPPDSSGSGHFLAAFRMAEFRALWIADTVSVLGTQVSRVCLALIVFDHTRSATATALVYALTFLPTLVGGALLSGFADRVPRRAVMITSDLARGALFAVMAIPQLSILVTSILLVLAVLLDSPFRAAQTATLPDVLTEEAYSAGIALRAISLQAAQLAGYAVGGLLAAAVSPRFGLAVDALTFLASAVLIRLRVRSRPAPPREARQSTAFHDYLQGIREGLSLIARSPRLRVLAGFAVLSGFYVVPEGLAAPYASTVGGGSVATGLLMAADPAGAALGAWLLVKLLPESARSRWMGVLAILPGVVLVGLIGRPGLVVSLVLWFVAGAVSGFHIPASVEFVRAIPDNQRGQALGIVVSAMLTAQGLGVLAAGGVASASDPTWSIVVFGAVGGACAVVLALRWRAVRDH